MYSLAYILIMSLVILTLVSGQLYDESDIGCDIAKNEGLM